MGSKAKFYVYRNLHVPGQFSIKRHGIVCDRQYHFTADDVEFRVSKAGSKRAKRDMERNVHAYAVISPDTGYHSEFSYSDDGWSMIYADQVRMGFAREITYHPFKDETFTYKDTGEEVIRAEHVAFCNGKVYALERQLHSISGTRLVPV